MMRSEQLAKAHKRGFWTGTILVIGVFLISIAWETLKESDAAITEVYLDELSELEEVQHNEESA